MIGLFGELIAGVIEIVRSRWKTGIGLNIEELLKQLAGFESKTEYDCVTSRRRYRRLPDPHVDWPKLT